MCRVRDARRAPAVWRRRRGRDRAPHRGSRSATAHECYGPELCWTGRFDAGIASVRRALQLDPLSQIIQAWLGYLLTVARRPAEAVEHLRRVVEFDPEFPRSRMYLGYAYLGIG